MLSGSLQSSRAMIEENADRQIAALEEIKTEHLAEIAQAELRGWGRFFIGLSIGAGAGVVATIIVTLVF